MECNERIRKIRIEKGLTQQFVADLLHVTQRTYADYESARIRIPLERLIELARFYDVSLEYLAAISKIRGNFPKY